MSFRAAVEAWDIDAIADSLSEDVVFHSPILFKPFHGRATAKPVLTAVSEVLRDFEYTDEARGDSTLALRFRARVGGRELEGIDHLELDDDGRVARLTVFMRPLTAVLAFSEEMGARLEAAGLRR